MKEINKIILDQFDGIPDFLDKWCLWEQFIKAMTTYADLKVAEAVKAKDAEIEIMIEADRQRCIVYDEMVSELSEANKRIAHETNKVKALCAELDRKVRIVLPSECDNSKCAEEWESGDTNGFNRCLSLIKSLNEGAEFVEGK